MHLRKLTLVIGVFGALSANWTYGLGLGEITLNSSLDEPLKADIKLLQVRDLTADEIIVELATAEDFTRAGVDRIYFLQELNFKVELNNPGGPVVKVTSQKPVREPFLNFLVKTQWPSGRLLREYTVLLDIPVFTKESSTPVQPAQTRTPATQPAPVTRPVPEPRPIQPSTASQSSGRAEEPTRSSPSPAEPVSSVREEVVEQDDSSEETTQGSDVYGPVQANDTLWEIALRVRPTRNVSVQQTMLALQRLNPDAFINNNINLLKKGQVLRVPTQAEMTSLAQSEAVSEVAYQNNQWGGGAEVGAQLEGARTRPQSSTATPEPQGQLTLAAPTDSRSAQSSSGAGDSSAQQDALENELAISMEELDSARRESTELTERVSELDEQINTMERLLDVSNAELANLQQAAQQIGDASNSTELADQETPIDPVIEEPIVEEGVVEPTVEEPVVAEQPQPAPKPQVVRPPVPEKSLVDTLMDYIWYIVGALVLIIAGVFVFLQRRAQRQMEEFDSYDDEEMYTADAGSNDDFNELNDSNFDADEFELADDDTLAEVEAVAPQPTKSETGDAVAEADIYIAYGKFDQAEDMLVRAIEDEPNNAEAKLKLLEVYSETKNISKFDATYASLLAMGNNSVNQKAADLRSTIPGVGAYVAAEAADNLDFGDTDLSFDEGETSLSLEGDNGVPAENETESFDFDDLSFDLDEDNKGADAPSFATTQTTQETESDSIEFDFDLESTEDSLNLDGVSESLDLDDRTETAGTASEELDFNLDFDSDDTVTKSSGDQELTLDLDLDDDDAPDDDVREGGFSFDIEDTTDDDLTLTLDDDEPEAPVATPSNEISDDFLADLEFKTESTESTSNLNELDFDADDEEQGDLDDAFNMDMDDVDLAALDEEMDALVGGIDDIEDEEVRVIPTEVLPELSNEDLADLDLDDDLEESSDDTADLDDLISLDDSSLDNLSFDTGSPATTSDEGFGDFGENADGGEDDLENELDFLSDTDEVATKLDLARAYIDMGDKEGAKDILDEVMSEGNDQQKVEAQELIGRM